MIGVQVLYNLQFPGTTSLWLDPVCVQVVQGTEIVCFLIVVVLHELLVFCQALGNIIPVWYLISNSDRKVSLEAYADTATRQGMEAENQEG